MPRSADRDWQVRQAAEELTRAIAGADAGDPDPDDDRDEDDGEDGEDGEDGQHGDR